MKQAIDCAAKRQRRARLMMSVALVALSLSSCPAWSAPKGSRGKRKTEAGAASSSAQTASDSVADRVSSGEQAQNAVGGDNAAPKKAKVLSFGAVDVEGKMRTPQLLFFVNRVKAELDSTTQLQRSFMKELKNTAKEKGL